MVRSDSRRLAMAEDWTDIRGALAAPAAVTMFDVLKA
jgi:hypothetical protein